MNYAIIAAGEGSRLAQEGVAKPKPLVDICGEPMIGRLINLFCRCNAESISIIVNEQMTEVREYIESLSLDIPLNLVVKTTPSSMHSFFELSRVIPKGRFCLTTVDTIFREQDFRPYIEAMEADERYDGMMAVTDYIDDEKPLYVQTDDDLNITAFRDERYDGAKYISGGVYALNEKAIDVLTDCMERGVARMRNFQRALVDAGLRLKAYPMGKILDVDHAGDIEKAEKFHQQQIKFRNNIQMAEITIAGIMRAGAYSPNHIGNDAAIFNATADQLRKRGCTVNIYSEEQFNSGKVKERVILNMCREQESIKRLQDMEDDGGIVVNSGYGIENCTRERMTRILMGHNIPYPDSVIVNTDEAVVNQLRKAGINNCWIKRGDFHAMHKEDVSYVRHAEEAQEVLQEYFYRGIKRAVINRHLVGDLIKFYGIHNSPFFFWFYPFDEGHSKYGLEAINGKSKGIDFDIERLKDICHDASEALGVEIYGGDCIVSPESDIRIIDFNDWPSFAPCRNEAAPFIAKAVLNYVKSKLK